MLELLLVIHHPSALMLESVCRTKYQNPESSQDEGMKDQSASFQALDPVFWTNASPTHPLFFLKLVWVDSWLTYRKWAINSLSVIIMSNTEIKRGSILWFDIVYDTI